ncbi:hypothetical protein ACFO4L_09210 [Bacillus daqingensis]|uniref:Uncharacterized protein n=1 Tax=Bacillus daqingensis TaxID=872396 RepID=A0ABV9NWF2_9BACI
MNERIEHYEEQLTSFFMYQTLYLENAASLREHVEHLQQELDASDKQHLEAAYQLVLQHIAGSRQTT